MVALNAVRAAMCQEAVSLAIKLRCLPDGTRLWEAIKVAGGIKKVEVGFTLPPRGKAKPHYGKDRFSLGHVAAGLMLFNLIFDVKLVSASRRPGGEIGVKIRVGQAPGRLNRDIFVRNVVRGVKSRTDGEPDLTDTESLWALPAER